MIRGRSSCTSRGFKHSGQPTIARSSPGAYGHFANLELFQCCHFNDSIFLHRQSCDSALTLYSKVIEINSRNPVDVVPSHLDHQSSHKDLWCLYSWIVFSTMTIPQLLNQPWTPIAKVIHMIYLIHIQNLKSIGIEKVHLDTAMPFGTPWSLKWFPSFLLSIWAQTPQNTHLIQFKPSMNFGDFSEIILSLSFCRAPW